MEFQSSLKSLISFMISFADFVIIANGVSFIVDIIVFSRK